MRDIGAPLSSLKLLKEVAELMAADGKQRPSKSGMQTCRGLPANLRCGHSDVSDLGKIYDSSFLLFSCILWAAGPILSFYPFIL